VTWQVVKPELNLEKSVEYKAPPAYSGELVELLQASKLSLGVEEYLSVLAGDSVTITETYYQDKSFFPLRGERVKGEFSVYRGEDGVLSFEKGPTVRCETSYPGFLWGVVALYFLVMMAFSHTSENLEIFFLFYGLFSAIYYMLVLVFTVKFGCGYLALWLVLVWLVMLVLGVGIQKLKA
jgi:hypothetical protein